MKKKKMVMVADTSNANVGKAVTGRSPGLSDWLLQVSETQPRNQERCMGLKKLHPRLSSDFHIHMNISAHTSAHMYLHIHGCVHRDN